MIDKIVFGLAAVMIAEGLVYLLAPHALEPLLKALKSMSISARRQMGALPVSYTHLTLPTTPYV